jgi:hypothetical protein
MESGSLIQPTELTPLDGSEQLGAATVFDFWKWALGDLRMNNARGYLVEFLVAKALGDPSRVRVERGPYDVQAADGTLVEIKATGRLQSWATRKPSTPTWTFKSVQTDRVWSEDAGQYIPVDPCTRVHVWVFALHTVVDPIEYDPLNLDQWEFRVVPHRQLWAMGQISARLSFFDRLGIRPVAYAELKGAVDAARQENDRLSL